MLRSLSERLDRLRDLGLLVIRVGIGIAFLFHGWPKLVGGPERWERLATFAGLTVLPTLFGFVGAAAEVVGGLLFALGMLFRPAALFLFGTMVFAFTAHVRAGDGFSDFSHALELAILFAGMFFVGPGRYSVDEYALTRRRYGY